MWRTAGREFMDVVRARTFTHRLLRDRIVVLIGVTIVLDLVVAGIALPLERSEPMTEIHTYGSAFFWTSTQLLTVSSQLPNPISTGGRILDVLMEAYAITVVATLAGLFGAFFHRRGEERRAEAGIDA